MSNPEILNDEVMEFDTITIPMKDGTDKEFAIMDDFEFEGNTYMVVSEIIGDEIQEDLYIYQYRENEDDLDIIFIEDKDFDRIAEAYYKICEEDVEGE